jgi:hypothetical protein
MMPLACFRPVPRLGRLLMMVLLGVVLAGGHLGLLRVVAWTSMLIERCSDQPLALAISTTLDGKHPCRLCLVLDDQDGRDQAPDPHKPTTVAKLIKIVGLVTDPWCEPTSSAGDQRLPHPEAEVGEGIAVPPPVPPPIRS